MRFPLTLIILVAFFAMPLAHAQNAEQLAQWLKRFPAADTDGDGRLSPEEAKAYRAKLTGKGQDVPQQGQQKPAWNKNKRRSGVPRQFKVDAGWQLDRFPEHSVCYLPPEEIAKVYSKTQRGNGQTVTSFPKPSDGSLRIVGTGHSFMAPGYKTFPAITNAAGFKQQGLLTHTGGGITGSARYKWEQENGIFQFDGQPTPKLLASIANAKWDAMVWGPYFNDEPEYFKCWVDFCLKYNPDMKFYLSDAWPQLEQLDKLPKSEKELTAEVIRKLGDEKHVVSTEMIDTLNRSYPGRVFVLPTCEAMVLAVDYYHQGKLPGIAGIHKMLGKKERSLWRDHLGHLGPGLGHLEGYVFYATMYGRSPELIEGDVPFAEKGDFPSRDLDRVFRKIAWEAVVNNKLSGIQDKNANGISDDRESTPR